LGTFATEAPIVQDRNPISAADVGSAKSVSIDVSEMHHQIKKLRVEHFRDMTFVFFNGG
jgi:hypothetical protein